MNTKNNHKLLIRTQCDHLGHTHDDSDCCDDSFFEHDEDCFERTMQPIFSKLEISVNCRHPTASKSDAKKV